MTARSRIGTQSFLRVRETAFVHGLFYGRRIFCCKTAQFGESSARIGFLPSTYEKQAANTAKTCATLRLELEIRCSIRLSYGRIRGAKLPLTAKGCNCRCKCTQWYRSRRAANLVLGPKPAEILASAEEVADATVHYSLTRCFSSHTLSRGFSRANDIRRWRASRQRKVHSRSLIGKR